MGSPPALFGHEALPRAQSVLNENPLLPILPTSAYIGYFLKILAFLILCRAMLWRGHCTPL